jgi:thiamine biosynthesis lipoprotein
MIVGAIARESWRAIGTTAVVCVTDPYGLDEARRILTAELDRIDRAASHYREDSELTLVQQHSGTDVAVSDLLIEAMNAALLSAAATGGLVDPTKGLGCCWRDVSVSAHTVRIPPGAQLDLGATGKAFAADRAAAQIGAALPGAGVLVSLGGDIATAGPAPAGGWPVFVTDDHRSGTEAEGQTINLHSGALATSGTAVRTGPDGRGHHIIDPRSGASAATPWRTASVLADTCVAANTASTASIILGSDAPDWLMRHRFSARLVGHGGDVVTVGDWPGGHP